jgi:four helix bundle protein
MEKVFDHEKLKVYGLSLDFVEWVGNILPTIDKCINACDHLDRASTSIPLNIAEGNGKYSSKDRCRFFDIARGSALESSACLDVLVKRKKIDIDDIEKGKVMLIEIVSMLVGLIKSNSDRIYEKSEKYLEIK